jgi:Ran-binding protein 3
VFGGNLGQSAFGGLGGNKSGLSSFATPGSSTISGLSSKPARPFGAAATNNKDESDDEDEGEVNDDETTEKTETGKSKQDQEKRTNFVPTEGKSPRTTAPYSLTFSTVETGEEGEDTLLTGRGKLYLFHDKNWQERGVGPLKLNITKESPKKARLILRADGTHRLLLNAPITKSLIFGDKDGKESTDGKILFTAPTADGKIETYLLRVC